MPPGKFKKDNETLLNNNIMFWTQLILLQTIRDIVFFLTNIKIYFKYICMAIY